MKKYLSMLVTVFLAFSLVSTASAQQAIAVDKLEVDFYDAFNEDNVLTTAVLFSNVGNTLIYDIEYAELDIYGDNETYLGSAIFEKDEILKKIKLYPGETYIWSLEVTDIEPDPNQNYYFTYNFEYTTETEALVTSGVHIVVDNKQVKSDVEPVIVNGTTLVPLRAVFNALGAEVTWNNAEKTVYAEKADGSYVFLKIGDHNIEANGEVAHYATPAQIINGSTMVPLRAVAEAFYANVEYGKAGKAAIISINSLDELFETYE